MTDLHPNDTHHTGDIDHESDFALVGLIACVAMFVGCCARFVKDGSTKESQDTVEALKGKQQKLALEDGLMNFTGLFRQDLLGMVDTVTAKTTGGGEGIGAGLLDAAPTGGHASQSAKHKVEKFLKPIFSKYDADRSGDIDVHELTQLFKDLGEEVSGTGDLYIK